MPPLPVVSGRRAIRAFESLGWTVVRRSESRVVLTRFDRSETLSIPDHGELDGILRALIRTAGLTVEDFIAASR